LRTISNKFLTSLKFKWVPLKFFLSQNGFRNSKNNDYYHPQLGIILEDLHDENVLTKDGVLHFINTVFFIKAEFYQRLVV